MNKAVDKRQAVMQAVEDHIADSGRLPSTSELIQRLGMPERTVRESLDELESQGRLTAAYKAPKNPTIYLPTYMYNQMRRGEKVPTWMSNYEFAKAKEIEDQISAAQETLNQFKQIQRLLYGTGRPLEESVSTALKIIGVDDLLAPYDDPDSWDLSFSIKGTVYIADIKGKSKWADKPDVAQLQLWLMKYVDANPQARPDRLRGLLIVNAFKDIIPTERWPKAKETAPISEAGIRYLQVGGLAFVTTADLFVLASQVLKGKLSEDGALQELPGLFREKL